MKFNEIIVIQFIVIHSFIEEFNDELWWIHCHSWNSIEWIYWFMMIVINVFDISCNIEFYIIHFIVIFVIQLWIQIQFE